MAGSPYFRWKFEGLANQFPQGCRIVRLDEGEFLQERLEEALEAAWSAAGQLRAGLIAAASEQCRLQREAFDWIAAAVHLFAERGRKSTATV